MKFYTTFLMLIVILLFSCNESIHTKSTLSNNLIGKNDLLSIKNKNERVELKYPKDCLSDDVVYTGADLFKELENIAIEATGVEVSDVEVNDFGDEAIEQIRESGEFKFIYNDDKIVPLKTMLNKLLSKRENPSNILYKIHLVDDKLVNAFTVGGHIIITTGIIKKTNSQSALAYIIGHEIGHNEKGHLAKTIKKLKIANEFAEGSGNIAIFLQNLITPAFNQPNEIESDYYGANLCYLSNYDPRKGIDFWRELSKDESNNQLEAFMRSHPYSSSRATCLREFLKINYNLE